MLICLTADGIIVTCLVCVLKDKDRSDITEEAMFQGDQKFIYKYSASQ